MKLFRLKQDATGFKDIFSEGWLLFGFFTKLRFSVAKMLISRITTIC